MTSSRASSTSLPGAAGAATAAAAAAGTATTGASTTSASRMRRARSCTKVSTPAQPVTSRSHAACRGASTRSSALPIAFHTVSASWEPKPAARRTA